MTKRGIVWTIAAVSGFLVFAGVAALAIWLYVGLNDPLEKAPEASYQVQVMKTLATFDSGERTRFDALYPHSLRAQRDLVWDACSKISPHGRTVAAKVGDDPLFALATIAGVDKKDAQKRVTCTFTLHGEQTGGRWDIYLFVPDTSAPSIGPPHKP